MKKLSMHKLSFLGFALLVASAVTAAVMPNDKSDKEEKFAPGNTLRPSTGGCANQLTCTDTDNILDNSCNRTESETTTNCGENNPHGTSTIGNCIHKTTFDRDGNDNSTSDLGSIQTTHGIC